MPCPHSTFFRHLRPLRLTNNIFLERDYSNIVHMYENNFPLVFPILERVSSFYNQEKEKIINNFYFLVFSSILSFLEIHSIL